MNTKRPTRYLQAIRKMAKKTKNFNVIDNFIEEQKKMRKRQSKFYY